MSVIFYQDSALISMFAKIRHGHRIYRTSHKEKIHLDYDYKL